APMGSGDLPRYVESEAGPGRARASLRAAVKPLENAIAIAVRNEAPAIRYTDGKRVGLLFQADFHCRARLRVFARIFNYLADGNPKQLRIYTSFEPADFRIQVQFSVGRLPRLTIHQLLNHLRNVGKLHARPNFGTIDPSEAKHARCE